MPVLDRKVYPEARLRLMHPENEKAGLIEVESVIVHTVVDAKGHTDLGAYLDRPDVSARVQLYNPRSGRMDQLMHLNRRPAASRKADAWSIAIENEDDSHGRHPDDFLPFTGSQMENLIEFGRWCLVPGRYPRLRRQVCTNALYYPGRSGFGYHSQPMKERWDRGYNWWTSFQGKECPTDPRIRQLKTIVFPAILDGTIPTSEEEFTMEQYEALMGKLNEVNERLMLLPAMLTGSEIDPNRWREDGKSVFGLNDAIEDIEQLFEALKLGQLHLAVQIIRRIEAIGLIQVDPKTTDDDLADAMVAQAQIVKAQESPDADTDPVD